jgi:hypothetical protein
LIPKQLIDDIQSRRFLEFDCAMEFRLPGGKPIPIAHLQAPIELTRIHPTEMTFVNAARCVAACPAQKINC